MSQGQYNVTKPTVGDGRPAELQVGSRGALIVQIADYDGTASAPVLPASSDGSTAANGGLIVIGRNTLFNGTTWDRDVKPNATARLLTAAASTNATSVKASAGNVHKVVGVNTNAAARFLKFYNKASAPTVGTDTPIYTFYLPPTAVGGGVFEFNFGSQPHYFSLGIAYALTTAAADADTGALTAGDVVAMNIAYS